MRRSVPVALLALAGLAAAATNLSPASATSLALSGDASGHTTLLWQAAFTPLPLPYRLTVAVTGDGSVVSDPAAIDCPSGPCQVGFTDGTTVTLSPVFGTATTVTWTGCDSITLSDDCIVAMTSDRSVSADFE